MSNRATPSETAREADRVMLEAAKEFRDLVREARRDYRNARASRTEREPDDNKKQGEKED